MTQEEHNEIVERLAAIDLPAGECRRLRRVAVRALRAYVRTGDIALHLGIAREALRRLRTRAVADGPTGVGRAVAGVLKELEAIELRDVRARQTRARG